MSLATHQAELRVCQEITQELMQMPCAVLFNEPVKAKLKDYERYVKVIKNPQDLGTILKRLQSSEYQNYQQWEKDIALVWSNAEAYNGKDSYVTQIARHMAKQCESMKKRISMQKISGWMKYLYIWREKLDKLLVSPPQSSTIRFFPDIKYIPPEYKPLTSKEKDQLIEQSRIVAKGDDLKHIAKIVELDPQGEIKDDNVVINVDLLSPKTLYSLQKFYKKRVSELNE
ncbi:Bromodomain containing protein [Trichomonas vaginalis G3]|uniref:Bromodomain containing protein n=1 Tax=Trichomonas vaginalis (strain ATCC PRA-98 / G3) TaxID=412133 RepID=A2DZV1_TRIV3|nr:chromatin remodeling [Trichomonas vaginalis G3]EAY14010.1 Bromodomain containing protein [Trichomonas vaginalis G3]KAI5519556.1 chromatin remodeling [Trichomonas vaginalis G3]|eukprot:XP_001326233.1 Bromodomain containing protein [Trichomonas vaginalis G3]